MRVKKIKIERPYYNYLRKVKTTAVQVREMLNDELKSVSKKNVGIGLVMKECVEMLDCILHSNQNAMFNNEVALLKEIRYIIDCRVER